MLRKSQLSLDCSVAYSSVHLDKLKSRGRREAWDRDENNWSWNPFARGVPQTRRRAKTDLEAAPVGGSVPHSQTSPVLRGYSNDFNPKPDVYSNLSQRPPTTDD